MSHFIFKELSFLLLQFAFSVHNDLGPGLLENIYESAFCIDLTLAGIPFERQKAFPVYYKNRHIGSYFADIVINNKIIVELKSVTKLTPVMYAQVINYLKISKLKVGYLMNFNPVRLEWKRFVNQGKGES